MKYNYHTHTSRCRHARGTDEEYVKAAIENGYEIIGFADHCAWHYDDPTFVSGMRMRESEIEDYVNSIRALQEKYKDVLPIKLGWEVEYLPKYWDWMKETLKKYEFDYIILGHHFCDEENGGTHNNSLKTVQQIEHYGETVCECMDEGLISYVAHPDVYMSGYQVFDEAAERVAKKIIAKSNETGIPIEYNLLGLEHSEEAGRMLYPYTDFWKLAAEMGATAIVGIDAHNPESYNKSGLQQQSIEMLDKMGLKMVDTIKYLR